MNCQQCGSIVPEGNKFCGKCGAVVERRADPIRPPPPPARGQTFVVKVAGKPDPARARRQAQVSKPGQPWPFQDQTTRVAAQIIRALRQSGVPTEGGFGGMLARMIRGALLDKTIYAEVAGDGSLQAEAWMVIASIIACSTIGFSLTALSIGFGSLASLGSSAVIQLVALLARAWVVQIAASTWLERPVALDQTFRVLAYAQAPAILQIVPLVGQFAGAWTLVTTTAAVRDVTRCDTLPAAVLAAVGVAGMMLATSAANPIVRIFL